LLLRRAAQPWGHFLPPGGAALNPPQYQHYYPDFRYWRRFLPIFGIPSPAKAREYKIDLSKTR